MKLYPPGVPTPRSAEKEKLFNFLLPLLENRGAMVSYAEISRECGLPVGGAFFGVLTSVRRRLETEHQIVTEAIRGIGITSAADSRIVEVIASAGEKAAGRKLGRTTKKLVAARNEQLSPAEQKAKDHRLAYQTSIRQRLSLEGRTVTAQLKASQAMPQLPAAAKGKP